MASRFELLTDVDRMLALRSAGLLYYRHVGRECLLPAEDIPRGRQEWLSSVQDYYALVEEDGGPTNEGDADG